MELTKAQLENERKIQQLQMQAINALWKKVSTMQGGATVTSATASMADNAATATVDGSNISVSTDSGRTLALDNSSTAAVHDLAKTCTMLTNQVKSLFTFSYIYLFVYNLLCQQVQQLQGSMRDILNCLTLFCNLPQENVKKLLSAGVADALATNEKRDCAATQTEIVAVHTPQIENQSNFPFSKIRPSTLPLDKQKCGGGGGGVGNASQQQTVSTSVGCGVQSQQFQHLQHEKIAEDAEPADQFDESGIQSEDVRSVDVLGDTCGEKSDGGKE